MAKAGKLIELYPSEYDYPWYDPDCPEDMIGQRIVDTCKGIEDDQADIHQLNLDHARLYSNREPTEFSWGNPMVRQSVHPISGLTENLSRTFVDALTNSVGKQKSKPTPITRGADFVLRREARKLDHWYYGQFKKHNIWGKGRKVFKDCLQYLFGAMYHERDGDDFCVERVHPDQIVVDQLECPSGTDMPKTMFRRRVVQLEPLLDLYPEYADELIAKGRHRRQWSRGRATGHGWVIMVEAWCRQIGSRVGAYACVVDGILVKRKPYRRTWFPFTWLHFSEPDSGIYGGSAIELIVPYQIRLNELNMTIREGQDVMCRPRIAVEQNSAITETKFDNRIGRQLLYRGREPKALVWPAFPTEIYAERQKIKDDCFQDLRMGQTTRNANFSEGMRYDSSRAIREAGKTEDEAWADLSERLQDFYLNIAIALSNIAEEIQADGGSMPTTWVERRRSGEVDFSKIDLTRDAYTITMEASSPVNETPAARMDRANELITRGVFSRAEIVSMLEQPDLEHSYALLSAQWELAEWVVAELEEERAVWPDENMDLSYVFYRVKTQVCLWLTMTRVPTGVFRAARNFLVRTHGLMVKAGLVPPPGAAGLPGSAPGALPSGPGALPGADMGAPPIPGLGTAPGSPTPLPAAGAISQVL